MSEMQRNVWIIAFSIIMGIVIINNSVYFFLSKKSLEEALNNELLGLSKQLEMSVEQSRIGTKKFEEQIGRELRTAAIAAQYALDPDIENVTNEQLTELSSKLDLSHITLLKRTEDDIVLYRSSDASQLNKSTKNWYPWHIAFNQLFDQRNVTVEWLGQKLPNFWSGPFEFSSTDASSVYKWGYYHDGTTNYIVDPYISYDDQAEYERLTGVERLISTSVKENDTLLEITVINPETFPHSRITTEDNGVQREHMVQRPIFYGSYEYASDSDVGLVKEAYASGQIRTSHAKVSGKNVYKMFVPVFVTEKGIDITDEYGKPMNSYVLILVSDYEVLQKNLGRQFMMLGLITILLTFISMVIAYVIMRVFRQSREKAVHVAQETYVEEMNQLFNVVRAQRHDFINHVQAIYTMAQLKKTEELEAYAKELTGEIRLMNDVINIGNPAIAALVRSKASQAESYKIEFICGFGELKLQGMGAKVLDVNRILGNLIDNAFDEVQKYPEDKRIVTLKGKQMGEMMQFTISNYCENVESVLKEPIFESGYSTKRDHGQHHGLGLAIVRSIVSQYRGDIKLESNEANQLSFVVTMPF